MENRGRSTHDVGGLHAARIDRGEYEPEFWEKRVDALLMVLVGSRKLITVDELRHGIESLGESQYRDLSYYERWIASITMALIEKGVISTDELGRKMSEVEARTEAAPE